MSVHDDGGPAFPAADAGQQHFGDPAAYIGMTLRDYFAAKAMQAVVADPRWTHDHIDTTASGAYLVADAMLKARNQ